MDIGFPQQTGQINHFQYRTYAVEEVSKFSVSKAIGILIWAMEKIAQMFNVSKPCISWNGHPRRVKNQSIRLDGLLCHSSYSLKVLRMEQSGVGDYAIWPEQLKARLLAQGLFSQDKSVLFPNTHRRLV